MSSFLRSCCVDLYIEARIESRIESKQLDLGSLAVFCMRTGLPIVHSDYQSGPTTLTGRSKVLDGLSGTVQLFGPTVWIDSPGSDFVAIL